jgi:hypothetical protein
MVIFVLWPLYMWGGGEEKRPCSSHKRLGAPQDNLKAVGKKKFLTPNGY